MEDFVNYEQALALKELGFSRIKVENTNSSIFGYYYNKKFIHNRGLRHHSKFDENLAVTAPLYQQAFRWLREKYGLYGYPFSQSSQTNYWFNYFIQQNWKEQITSDSFSTSEEAELECLKMLIEIAQKKNEQRRVQTSNNNT